MYYVKRFFNDMKVIHNKKANLQVMYVRDFRASIFACKDNKIKVAPRVKTNTT